MKLSNRIIALRDAVNQGESVADIGTDHGYVPLLLYKEGKSPRVIMSDISEGSLSKAIENFALVGINIDESCFRIGDGLDTIEPGEVDDVIIGGLGGKTLIDILSNDMSKTKSFKRLILQPRNNCGELRCFLYTHGFNIDREILVSEGKFICEIICASIDEETDFREPLYDVHDIRWKYPEAFKLCDSKLLQQRLKWKYQNILDEINSLKKSSSDQSQRIMILENDYNYLQNLEKDSIITNEKETGNI